MLLLAGCLGNSPEPIQVTTKPIEKPELVLPPVDELNLRKVEWIVINEDNMEEKLAELTSGGQPLGIFVLTGDGYENLGINFSDIRALVQQQQAIILAYENYYKASTEAIDEVNQQIKNINTLE